MFKELSQILDPGVHVDMTVSCIKPGEMSVSLKIRGKSADTKEKYETRPIVATGTPEELEASLSDFLLRREEAIKKAFMIDVSGFDTDLSGKPEKPKAASSSKSTAAKPKATETSAKPEKPAAPAKPSPEQELEKKLDELYDQIEATKDGSTLLRIKQELKGLQKKDKTKNVRIANMIQSVTEKILNDDEDESSSSPETPETPEDASEQEESSDAGAEESDDNDYDPFAE